MSGSTAQPEHQPEHCIHFDSPIFEDQLIEYFWGWDTPAQQMRRSYYLPLREAAGKAAAPAVNCRNRRRGSFMACPLRDTKAISIPAPQKGAAMAGRVQVFGRRNIEAIPALGRPASEKRQGTKSRGVGHRQCSGRYGDFGSVGVLRKFSRGWRLERFGTDLGRVCWGERTDGRLLDRICGAITGQFCGPAQAGVLAGERQP
jgi:hypothetical protein